RDCFLLFVFDRPRDRQWIDKLLRDLRYLLHRSASLYRHRDFAAGIYLASLLFASVSSPVRSGLRRVDEFDATGVFANLIRGAAYAAGGVHSKSAARTTVASRRIRERQRLR